MQSILFPSRMRNVVAFATSCVALLALAAYVSSTGTAVAAKLTATYHSARHALVEGVVTSPNGHADRQAEVALVFRGARGRIIERKLVKVNRRGRFYVTAPTAARSVRLTAYLRPGKHAAQGSRTIAVVPGKAASVTVVFHRSGGGVLPAIFPY